MRKVVNLRIYKIDQICILQLTLVYHSHHCSILCDDLYVGAGGAIPPNLSLAPPQIFGYSSSMQ